MRTKSILPALLFLSAFFPASFFAQNPCDTVQIVAQATATNLTCNNPVATLTGALHPSALSYQWSGPGGFSADDRVAYNFQKGLYKLTVTGAYGCTATASVTVADDCTSYPLEPPACDPPFEFVVPGEDCWNACVMPYLPQNVPYHTAWYWPGNSAGGWCGTIENDQWFAFVAGATGGSITATSYNCANGDGIQLGLYDECPGYIPLACEGGGSGMSDVPVTLNVSGLNIGEVYYLVVDGYAGDQCEFVFESTPGLCDAPSHGPPAPLAVQGPSLVCPEAAAEYSVLNLNSSYASAFLWTAPTGATINGMGSPALIYKPEGETVVVNFSDEGGFVCFRQIYYFYPPSAPICFPVINEPIPPTILPPVKVCFEDLPYELPCGDQAFSSGIYDCVFESWLGCDSVVKQQVIVLAPIVMNLAPQYRCAGDCVTVGGETFCDPGNYTVVLESWQGCDSLVNFTLLLANPVAEILGGGMLTCTQSSIALSSAPSPGSKLWKNAATGQILGNGNTLTVTQPGQYVLTTTQVLGPVMCVKSDTIEIVQDTDPVQALTQGGTLTCSNPLITLSGSASDPTASLSWTGPNGFTATGPSPLVSTPGNYQLIATAANGCTGTASATVAADQDLPILNVTGGALTCANPVVQLGATSPDPGVTFTWIGPNGFSATGPDPAANVPGQYECFGFAPNGCSASVIVTVGADLQAPALSATGGTLTCASPQIALAAASPDPGVIFAWTGPDGFSAIGVNPLASLPGVYECTGTAANGCTASATATVVADQQAPVLGTGSWALTCLTPQAQLSGIAGNTSFTYVWTGPDGFIFIGPEPIVSLPGTYTCVATGLNGCTASATVEVESLQQSPPLGLSADTVDCSGAEARVYAEPAWPTLLYAWSGPDGFAASEPAPAVVLPGWYAVTVTDPINGCTSTGSVEVAGSLELPDLDVAQAPPGCGDTLLLLDAGSAFLGVQFHWTGPNGFISQEEDPVVTAPGWYKVTAVTAAGCEASINILVVAAPQFPLVTATGAILTCLQPSAALQAAADLPASQYSWTGPGGFISAEAGPVVDLPGIYQLTLTAANGCTAVAEAEVVADVAAPQLSAAGGVITCAQPVVALTATSTTPGASLSWLGGNWPVGQAMVDAGEPGDYTVVATAPNGCTASVTVSVADSCLTGIQNPADGLQPGIRAYPNASSGVVFVEITGTKALDALRVLAVDGRLVWSADFEAPQALHRLDLTAFPPGAYVVSARIEGRWFWEKLVLMR